MSTWDNTVTYLEEKVKGFEIKEKDDVWHQALIGKVLFFSPFMRMWSALYPKVWRPSDRANSWSTLQHEGIHLMDAQTFYGLLPAWPVLKWVNVALFSISYALPQLLFLLSLLSIGGNLWWLFCLLFLVPLPSPGRMIAEMRAYRRTREAGRPLESMVDNFTKEKYYFMWPFPRHVRKLLAKPSPYRDDMDRLRR